MCPACRARYRGTRTCSRCGADLSLLMRLEIRAWRLREAARLALLEGRPAEALRFARASCRVRRTERGEALLQAAMDACECVGVGNG
jgi:hypothetical protein